MLKLAKLDQQRCTWLNPVTHRLEIVRLQLKALMLPMALLLMSKDHTPAAARCTSQVNTPVLNWAVS